MINAAPRAGFSAILKQVKKDHLTLTDVVFIIAPRINAAGRMKHGLHAVNLLTEEDPQQAMIYAAEIEEYNKDRRDKDKTITEEALAQIVELKEQERLTTVVYRDSWHKGVIGIVASRLTETYYRPTLVFTRSGEKLAASARSVHGFDVYDALEGCSEYIEQFGGHKYAAGLTLQTEQYENFKRKFEEVVSASIDRKLLIPEIQIDAEIDLGEITEKFIRIIKQFAPFGPGNMSPVFMSRHIKDTGYARCVGGEDKHLKARLFQKLNGRSIDAIGFDLGKKCDLLAEGKKIKAVYCIEENEFQGNVSLQLKLKDVEVDSF